MKRLKIAEEWIDLTDHVGLYRVSTHGRVMSLLGKSPRIINVNETWAGYQYVNIKWYGKWQRRFLHHVVALAYYGQRPVGHEIHHIDHNRANNAPHNLQYVTAWITSIYRV